MVGLADIPCVGKIVDKVSDIAVEALYRGLRYMFCYKALVEQLNSETEKLNIEKEKMSRKIKEEEDNGKIIEDYVLTWQKDVEVIQKGPEEFSASCSCIQSLPIPNPASRFRMGRNAAKKAIAVAQLTATGKDHLTAGIAHLPPVENIPRPHTAFEEFQSRKDTYRELYDVLVDEDSPLVHGIYGMPGVGKTRMMEKIWEDAMKEKVFDKVVRVNVGNENVDKIKLQDQIAGSLNCHLESQDVERRASQLKNSLRNGGKILLILDDVWTEICLDDIIGNSFGDDSSAKGSKILLTSREKDVCLDNNCEHPLEIKALSPDEALYLFKNIVDPHKIKSLQDESLVQEVCAECGRLPLLIHAVGKALKGKSHHSWKDAHNQLKNGKFEKIVGVDPKVYVGIKLSIDYLRLDDARSCLFLCSMFPEDANIDMRILTMLATSSQLIPDGESRIPAMVDYLKTSSLLLDSGENNETKVHDIIRDVARSVAFADSRYAFLQVTCNSRYLPSNANYHTRKFLRLDAETAGVHFNEDLECQDLRTLWLQSNNHPQQFSGGFFRMFSNLSSLMLQKLNISLQQFSLQPLGKLETLCLMKCDIRNTDVSLFPEKLKTLWIYECDLPLPLDLANLIYLRKLEIQVERRKPKLVMVSNVMSTLSSLEELHIPDGIIIDSKGYQTEPIVMEISRLTNLRSLNFCFNNENTFQVTNKFSNVDRYNITVRGSRDGSRWLDFSDELDSARSIQLYGKHSDSWEGLMARAEELRLMNSNVEVSSIFNSHRKAFEDLKVLYIRECDNMGYLASISQYEIQRETCFSKVTILEIDSCSKLKYLFCNNTAKNLVQLQQLLVGGCKSMEAIILNDGTSDGEIINFPKLKSLKMISMWRLGSFLYTENKNIHSAQVQPLFDEMVAFPSLEELCISRLAYTSVIWGNDCFNNDTLSSFCKLNRLTVCDCNKLEIVIPQAMLHRLNNLEYIDVSYCRNLRIMFPLSVARDLTHLKELTVKACEKMTDIIETGERVITDQVITDDGILCPELTDLDLSCKVPFRLLQLSSIVLRDLPALKSFFHGANFEFQLPALKEVKVHSCGFSTLFTFSMFRKFQLRKLEVRSCKLLENIVEDVRGDETCDKIITLSQLIEVSLIFLPNLRSFFHNANYEFHMPVIKRVKVNGCEFYNPLFTRSVFKNFKQLEELSVRDCKLLESVIEDARADETLDTSDKIITLSQVTKVDLFGLPKLQSIFCGATYQCYMPALKNVRITDCGLSVLFTWSVFREIQQLEELYVSYCELLEHIVEEVGGDETFEIKGQSINYPKLSSITFQSLPNLKSFSCSPSYALDMPKLRTLFIRECPQVEYFSSSKTNTPGVHVIIGYGYGEVVQDLNDFLRENYAEEAT